MIAVCLFELLLKNYKMERPTEFLTLCIPHYPVLSYTNILYVHCAHRGLQYITSRFQSKTLVCEK
jgi:hypothetical protein